MIGGTDVLLENHSLGAPAVLEAVARAAHRHWPDAVFVDGTTGHRFDSFEATEFGALAELLVFRDEASRASCEQLGVTEDNAGSSLYAIAGRGRLTLVVDDPAEATAHAVIEEIGQLVKYGVPHSARAA